MRTVITAFLQNFNKKKLLIIISLLAVIIAIPLTVFISQKQQDIRQRASGKEATVFFAELESVSPAALSQISLSPNQQKIIALYLDTGSIPTNGYDIIVNFGSILQLVTINEVVEGTDASKLGFLIFKDLNQTTGKIRFSRTNIDPLPTIQGKLHLGSIAFTAKVDASGNDGTIDASYAEITSPGRDKLTVDLPSLSLTVVDSSPISVTSTPTPTTPAACVTGIQCEPCVTNEGNTNTCYENNGTSSCTFTTKLDSGECSAKKVADAKCTNIACISGTSCIDGIDGKKTCGIEPTPPVISFVTIPSLVLNVQDTPATAGNLSAELLLYSLTSNSKVDGAPATQLFTKTPISGKQYSAVNLMLTNLPQGKYLIIARKGNMRAKYAFTVSKADGQITVPAATLVFGDLNNDNDINTLDYNMFKTCWVGKVAASTCASSDFDGNEAIDQIDYNTWLRGLATWSKEGIMYN